MEGRKARVSTDELAVVKAAAWAWYQHGSGSEGKRIREFDLTRTWQAPKPSRYKLEATEIARNTTDGSQPPSQILSPIHTDNSLLDRYEIGRISKQLEYLIESSRAKFIKESNFRDEGRWKNKPERRKKMSKRLNGFWLRHPVVCGSRGDVVEAKVMGGLGLPKDVPVIRLANCRPRANDDK